MSTRGAVASALITAALVVVPVSPASAPSGSLVVTATIDGQSLEGADLNRPLPLRADDSTQVTVTVRNDGDRAVTVRGARLDAKVVGLSFLSYTARVDLTVDPGQTSTRTFALDLDALAGQATGLLPAQLTLLSPDHKALAEVAGTVDVRGKVSSVYGVFGLAIAAITGLLLLALVVRLLRRTLPESRWSRACLFAVPGAGVGLVGAITLGIARIADPAPATAWSLLLGGLAIGFSLGSLTPAPSLDRDRDDLDVRDVVYPGSTPAKTTARLL